jgi:cellulose synthase/poly-beta-1,6-N-acetylglucosamine synthase-like glycosyltransferase
MNLFYFLLLVVSVLLALQSAYSAALMLYAWQDETKRHKAQIPATYKRPRINFTILLPARHEEAVIQDTIQRVVDLNYPRELVQVLIIIEAGDHGTISKVNEKLAQLYRQGIFNVELLTFSDKPINKPHGLNIGLQHSKGNVITIFDAEDEPHPEILQVVNTVITREFAPVVQCGVQLMNFRDRWFSALNVLEYFFWFKSRLHYQASAEIVPLGGNTVFVWRQLLDWLGGWDQYCLTEDADVGIRLSAANVPIRVIYEDEYVTKEETPPTVGQFIKQRTRWNQGFLQVLAKRDWLKLPGFYQKFMALYILCSPLLQLLTLLYMPVSLWTIFFLKVPAWLALITSLPFYLLVIQLLINMAGLREFTRAHKLKTTPLDYLRTGFAFIPYQVMLGWGALRACWRQLLGMNSWEKTVHLGAHRAASIPPVRPHVPAGQAPLVSFAASFKFEVEQEPGNQGVLEEVKLG